MPGSVISLGVDDPVVQRRVASDPQRASERASLRRQLPAPCVVVQPGATAWKPTPVIAHEPDRVGPVALRHVPDEPVPRVE